MARPREVPTKKEKVAKGWRSDSLQRHLTVGSGSKNLELQRHLLGILRYFLFSLESPHVPRTMMRTSGKDTHPYIISTYPNCSDVS